MAWKKYLSSSTIKELVFDMIINDALLVSLEICQNIPRDLHYYVKVVDIIKPLMGTHPLVEGRRLEKSFLKTIDSTVSKSPVYQTK